MPYEFYNAYRDTVSSPSNYYFEDFQALTDEQFDNASDVYIIQEEKNIGTEIYTDAKVRITHVMSDKQTGEKLGDDWRELIFPTLDYPIILGKRFKFDDNIFLTVNTDNYHYITKSCVIRRCNNVLSWYDETAKLYIEPCCIDFKNLKGNSFDYGQVVLAKYDLIITVQRNDYTKNIKFNQRFVIDGYAYKIDAINNFRRQKTYDKDSTPLLMFGLYKDPIAPDDDLINNIANVNQYKYTLSINQSDFTESINYTTKLTSTLKLNDVITTQPLQWTSSDETKATINNSDNLTLLAEGTVTITCSMVNNPLVSNSIIITVVNNAVSSYSNLISPSVTSLLQGKSQTYTVNGLTDGIVNSDTFTISASGIPSDYYKLVINNGNSFAVTNLKLYTGGKLNVVCVNNRDSSSVNIEIQLKGLY